MRQVKLRRKASYQKTTICNQMQTVSGHVLIIALRITSQLVYSVVVGTTMEVTLHGHPLWRDAVLTELIPAVWMRQPTRTNLCP